MKDSIGGNESNRVDAFTLLRYSALPLLLWSTLVGISLWSSLDNFDRSAREIVTNQGRDVFHLIEAMRVWNAEHGGIFVLESERDLPNPYLDESMRSLRTDKGERLTRLNPAYMTRQVSGVIEREAGVRLHLTSLNPINPGNKADDWEAQALRTFEQGRFREQVDFDHTGGKTMARYIAPLFVKQGCLQCHEKQGYKLGDVRGGLGVQWSVEPVITTLHKTLNQVLIVHAAVWLLVTALMVAGIRQLLNNISTIRDSHLLAFYDVLTGLPNRRMLMDRLAQAMASSKRSGLHGALMFLDLDNFKPLNDTYGHEMGDMLLVEVAERIRRCVREVDTVARFGGDEFVVMLSQLDTGKNAAEEKAKTVAEKIRQSLSESYQLPLQSHGKTTGFVEHRCSVSIGVVTFAGHEANEQELLNRADNAMYEAKLAGRNQIRFLSQSDSKRQE